MSGWASFYAEAKGWQTAIGSMLGFVALVSGALINYSLNRKRDQRLRDEEIASIASAVYGEVLLLRQRIARLAQFVGKRYLKQGLRGDGDHFDKFFRETVEVPSSHVYRTLVAKIGMLPPSIALEVSKFYARVEEVQAWLPRLQENPERKYSYSVASVIRPALEAVKEIEPTLRDIEKLTGIPAANLETKVKDARLALEMEDES